MKKTEDKIINASSKYWPMKTFYGNVSPQLERKEKACIRLFPDLRNGFNNESPDFFRMDCMKENLTGYKNPYLNVVKTVDRSLFFKNNESCIDHINMINKVKCKRDMSQNPKILKQLDFSTDINKLENKLHKNSKTNPYMYRTLSSDFVNPEYEKKIKILNGEYLPNHHYFTKNSFNLKKVNENQFINSDNFNIKINEEGKNDENFTNRNLKTETNNKFNHYYNNTISANGFFKDSVLEEGKIAKEEKKVKYNVKVNDLERAFEGNHVSKQNSTTVGFNINSNSSKKYYLIIDVFNFKKI